MKNISNTAPRSKLFFGILFLLLILFLSTVFSTKIFAGLFGTTTSFSDRLIFSRILFWICLLIIFIYSRKVEGQKLLLIEEKRYSIWGYILSALSIFAVMIVGCAIISATLLKGGFSIHSDKMGIMLEIFRHNYFLLFLTAITAGFVEELTFRGYLMPRMTLLFKSPVISILFSSVLFGLLHFGYGTVFEIACPFFIGLVLAFYYYEFRNIKVIIFCHALWDVVAILLNLYKKH